jgi:hypothetical protein
MAARHYTAIAVSIAHSRASGRSFQQHPVTDSGVSGHLGMTPLGIVRGKF